MAEKPCYGHFNKNLHTRNNIDMQHISVINLLCWPNSCLYKYMLLVLD